MSFIKIYFGDKLLYITDEPTPEMAGQTVLYDSSINIKDVMNQSSSERVWFIGGDIEGAQKELFKDFRVAVAGGGLVQNNDGAILLIYRRKRWDLPKGHLDEGETIEQCALREVHEETGLATPSLLRPLIITRHVYTLNQNDLLKETHWYLMYDKGSSEPVPQKEEDIERIEWVNRSALPHYYPEMFPLVKDVLNHYFSSEGYRK